jgi:hypothetical protein
LDTEVLHLNRQSSGLKLNPGRPDPLPEVHLTMVAGATHLFKQPGVIVKL